jgi:phospholipid-transporting ATPase
MIPISLYVALEIVRLLLANFIKNDVLMYNENTDRPAACRASDLIEELGQVQFVFSDKTGTLTCNEMIFRKCGINEKCYGSLNGRIEKDENFQKVLNEIQHPDHEILNEFCLMLVLCNSVFPARHFDQLVYHASSPDELALVEAARDLGYVLTDRIEGKIYISVKGEDQVWELMTEIPFNSDRKRMSVVVRAPNGKIYLYTKGADTKVIGLITSKGIPKAREDLHDFAVQGLRTLVFAYKELQKDDYLNWKNGWNQITLANAADKDDQLDTHAELLETSLILVGTSAIEDKLQDGVPETIKILMEASIRVWVLTGDKEETAIEIAKSCNLIQENMDVQEIFTNSAEDTKKRLTDIMNSQGIQRESDFSTLEKIKNDQSKPLAIVINGIALSFVLESDIKYDFFRLGFVSSSCICCRVSPSQKMYVVRLAKTYGSWISLAIGDGANDVSMIQEANIGVGIAGKEGTQAVQAAEFTFTEFKSLSRLLLVHGRLAYLRITLFILYYFYKNFISVFTEFWFALFNGFSGQIYFLDWLPSLYNVFWTSWPCMTFCTLERDLEPSKSLQYPALYSAGQKGAYFGVKTFWKWVLFAFMSACWIYWLPVVSCESGSEEQGRMPGLFWVSTVSFVMLIHTVNLKLLLVSLFWPGLSM